ncbi:hypothetical protein PSN01_04328 [Micromonospora saelicesensis]|nr:hypothetical protein PSN01_04328 [Micromonospora saelicesensis]
MSVRASDTPSRARSGATNCGEPSTVPGPVITPSPPSKVASPKSVSTTRPSSATSTLCGFTSRCSTPAVCAARNAASTASPIRAVRCGLSGPSAPMICCTDRDGTYSITIQGLSRSCTTS